VTTLRIVMLIDSIVGGGAERFVGDLAGALVERGASVTVCISRGDPPAATLAGLSARGVRPLALRRSSRVRLGPWRPLLDLLRSGRVDVLNTHLHSSNVYGSILSAASHVPLVATEHGSTAEGQRMRSALDRFVVAHRAQVVVASSDHTREWLLARGRKPQSVRVIRPAPAEAAGAVIPRADALRSLGLPALDVPVIGTVCALRREKRLDILLEATALIARTRAIHLVIVGDGPERPEIEAHARRLGLRGVTFAGWRDDAVSLLPAFDIFALTSDTEGTPLALIEAMRAGLPIVATDVGGVAAAAPDDESALLVPRRDPAALARAIERLLDDRALAVRLAGGATRHALAAHSLQQAADAWLEVLSEAAGRARGAA
jgi:glycosyltransferase involved in cell wall biosynthesis